MNVRMSKQGLALVAGLVAAVAAAGGAQASVSGDWQAATPVAPVNSPATEGCPIESPDGRSLYIMSTREDGIDQDIWVATRTDLSDEFGAPVKLPAPVNSDYNDYCPTPLRGKRLLFVSARVGADAYGTEACGGGDIFITRWRPDTDTWVEPRNLGCVAQGGPNSSASEFGPSLVETDAGTELFFSSGGPMGSNTQDIYVSRQRADRSFGTPQPVAELNTGSDDAMPNVSKDGLELVFASNRAGGQGAFDTWSSTRQSVFEPWSPPVNLGTAVNGPGPETRPSLSWDGKRLYFGRSGEIFVSHR